MAKLRGFSKAAWMAPQLLVIVSHLLLAAATFFYTKLPAVPNQEPSRFGVRVGIWGAIINCVLLFITSRKDDLTGDPRSSPEAYFRGRVWIGVVCAVRVVLTLAVCNVVAGTGHTPKFMLVTGDLPKAASVFALLMNCAALFAVAWKTFKVDRRRGDAPVQSSDVYQFELRSREGNDDDDSENDDEDLEAGSGKRKD